MIVKSIKLTPFFAKFCKIFLQNYNFPSPPLPNTTKRQHTKKKNQKPMIQNSPMI
jgi:hypothetical protein